MVNRRRFLAAQAVLAAVAVAALGLSASVIVRSIRTARLNRSLVAMHTVTGEGMTAEIAAPPLTADATAAPTQYDPASPYGELSVMTLPDGSPIVVPVVASAEAAQAPVTADFHRTDLDILPDMMKLVRQNPDTVGWLSIPGTVHLPVVYRDNTYYLDHDFTGAKNASGTLFLDEASPLTADTQNLVIHGHSMNDGSMFGILTHYRRLDYLRQHPLISFSTLWEKETYAVFAVVKASTNVNDADYFNYFSHPNFDSDAAFDAYIQDVLARSIHDIPVSVSPTDALLTLSTCLDEDHLVVFARRLRPEETRDELSCAVEESV